METTSILNAFLALLFVLGLVGLTSVAIRYFGAERFLTKTLNKAKNKRLKLVDYLTIDARRRLILVQRDDVEHLILVGGESETIIETNIKNKSAKQ